MQYYVDRCCKIQAMIGLYMNKAMTESPNYLRNSAIFRPKYIDCIFGMFECGECFGVFQ